MITARQFRDKYLGQAIDVDGVAGVQCVDLFKQVCNLAGKGVFSVGGSGYSDELVYNFDSLELNTYFDKVNLENVQYGDWLIWQKGSMEAPNSHVAMFIDWQSESKVIVLGQNQFGVKEATEGAISVSGIIGVLRLKELESEFEDAISPTLSFPTDINDLAVYSEYGMFTVTVAKLNFRNAPTTKVPVEGCYTKGQSVNYDCFVRNEGYVWISWISTLKGIRRWMVCRVVETDEAWGIFD